MAKKIIKPVDKRIVKLVNSILTTDEETQDSTDSPITVNPDKPKPPIKK